MFMWTRIDEGKQNLTAALEDENEASCSGHSDAYNVYGLCLLDNN